MPINIGIQGVSKSYQRSLVIKEVKDLKYNCKIKMIQACNEII